MALAKERIIAGPDSSSMNFMHMYGNMCSVGGNTSPVSDPSLLGFENYTKMMILDDEDSEHGSSEKTGGHGDGKYKNYYPMNRLPSLTDRQTNGDEEMSSSQEDDSPINFKDGFDNWQSSSSAANYHQASSSLLSFSNAGSHNRYMMRVHGEDDHEYPNWEGRVMHVDPNYPHHWNPSKNTAGLLESNRLSEERNSFESANTFSSSFNKSVSKDSNQGEERFSWLYAGASGSDDSGVQEAGCSSEQNFLKRPHHQLDGETQPSKKLCTGAAKKTKAKSPAPAKDPQSLAAKNRRERISERLKVLQDLVPNGTKVDLVTMLEKAISYVKFLQLQVKVLATDEFWPAQGGKAPEVSQVKEAIDAILLSHTDTRK
ncbi:hypothetical protein C5167_005478 [Papaver somniferum]|uniref:BHLH domain-containing protein n=1 Tax=Papaver somniferum TaxID=3469 RepID=A0A4Y7JE37_PAPSO|nr:transcription factor bHLH83-like [Papaver somniferum]RZC58171.1 hypothetical protein C5167_005478 [Papaver somniferum]